MATQSQFPDETSSDGGFERQPDAFREFVSSDGSTAFPATEGRYHLYISYACPWAHRTAITRHLVGLEKSIGLTAVDPVRDERGWAFREGPGHGVDPVNGFKFLSEAYLASDPDFNGRWTVPVLWDRKSRRIVNNSEDDICRMFATAFAHLGDAEAGRRLCPPEISAEQDELSGFVYENVNNGVYRAGFATKQGVYERACRRLFDALVQLDERLGSQRFLFGPTPTETDWRLFCTLVRFDAVYHGHFKCNLRRIIDYPHLWPYLRDLHQQPGIADTVKLDHIKRHYYITHEDINPTQIVPLGPDLDFSEPAERNIAPLPGTTPV
jgi:glutathionyl-hydroquinone reductase